MAGARIKVYNYTIVFEPVPEGGYHIVVPTIPEISTFGASLKEAKAMARDAMKCYLENALKANEEIPQDREPSIERIAVSI